MTPTEPDCRTQESRRLKMNPLNVQPTGDEEVCRIARELIRIDTTNYGTGNAVGEQKAADYVARLLTDVGLKCQCYEAEPGRTNLIARWKGADPDLPALLLHGHRFGACSGCRRVHAQARHHPRLLRRRGGQLGPGHALAYRAPSRGIRG